MRITFECGFHFFFSQKLRITFECGLNSSAGCFRVNWVPIYSKHVIRSGSIVVKGYGNVEKWRTYHQVVPCLSILQTFRCSVASTRTYHLRLVLVLSSCSISHVTLFFIVRFGKLQIFLVVFGKLQMFFSCISQMIEIGYWFQRNPREHPEAQLRHLNGIICSQKVAPEINIVTWRLLLFWSSLLWFPRVSSSTSKIVVAAKKWLQRWYKRALDNLFGLVTQNYFYNPFKNQFGQILLNF